jgi:hypothetical protein
VSSLFLLSVLFQPIVQMNENLVYTLITPADVATGVDVFPIPKWDERKFEPVQYDTTYEKAVVAVNTISIAFLLFLMGVVFFKRTKPVMKASAPVFCLLSLLGGVITLASNYALSLQPTATGCGVNAWLLTFGFTLMLAALLVKLGRLYLIFSSGRLTVVKITNTQLGLVLFAACVVDILLNAIWTGVAPFAEKTVVVDAFRPAHNYRSCDWAPEATALMYVHIAWKATLLLVALVLTILTRSLPAAFNESTFLGASVYNVSVLLCFLLPIISSGVGGRNTVYLLQGFGVQLIVVSTMAILFVPKIIQMHLMKANNTGGYAPTHQTVTQHTTAESSAGETATVGGGTKVASRSPPAHIQLASPSTGGRAIGPRGGSSQSAWARTPASPGVVQVRVNPPGIIEGSTSDGGVSGGGSQQGGPVVAPDVAQLKAIIEQLRTELAAAKQAAQEISPGAQHVRLHVRQASASNGGAAAITNNGRSSVSPGHSARAQSSDSLASPASPVSPLPVVQDEETPSAATAAANANDVPGGVGPS